MLYSVSEISHANAFYSHACEISRGDEIFHASEIPHVSEIFCHRNYFLPIIRIYHIIREQHLVKKNIPLCLFKLLIMLSIKFI